MTQPNIARQLIEEVQADPAVAAELALLFENGETRKLREELGEVIKRMDLMLDELTVANANAAARMKRNASTLKNMGTRLQAEKFAPLPADEMGMTHALILTPEELLEIGRRHLTGSLLLSFVQADIIILAQDGNDTAYIAAEVSYSGSRRDSQRALANAHVIRITTGPGPRRRCSASGTTTRPPRIYAQAGSSGSSWKTGTRPRTKAGPPDRPGLPTFKEPEEDSHGNPTSRGHRHRTPHLHKTEVPLAHRGRHPDRRGQG